MHPADDKTKPCLLTGGQLQVAVWELIEELRDRIVQKQCGTPTFYDNYLTRTIEHLARAIEKLPARDAALAWQETETAIFSEDADAESFREAFYRLRLLVTRKRGGRFVRYQDRANDLDTRSSQRDFDEIVLTMSQGVMDCMQWKGMPLFKTAFDLSIYTMLIWNLKPNTIIELGSGMGTSAIWMGDLLEMFSIPGSIVSIDLRPPAVVHPKVRFVEGNCHQIETVFHDEYWRHAPHPWLVVEDAHENVLGVLRFFHTFLSAGDYLVVEDSTLKPAELKTFLDGCPECYKVDSYYTDFFGRNATCAKDSIFVRR
jgi:cephalosporin hydroxylase